MTIFNAYQDQTTGETVCLADRFSWLALFLPPVWAVAHRLWLELTGIIAGVILLLIAANFLGLPFAALYLVGAIWLGFEARQLEGRALLRRGWRQAGVLNAADRISAETEAGRHLAGRA